LRRRTFGYSIVVITRRIFYWSAQVRCWPFRHIVIFDGGNVRICIWWTSSRITMICLTTIFARRRRRLDVLDTYSAGHGRYGSSASLWLYAVVVIVDRMLQHISQKLIVHLLLYRLVISNWSIFIGVLCLNLVGLIYTYARVDMLDVYTCRAIGRRKTIFGTSFVTTTSFIICSYYWRFLWNSNIGPYIIFYNRTPRWWIISSTVQLKTGV
jgi:hypothetical protein